MVIAAEAVGRDAAQYRPVANASTADVGRLGNDATTTTFDGYDASTWLQPISLAAGSYI